MKESRSVELDLEKLETWMAQERWNRTTLARRLDVDPSTMSRWLSGKSPPPYTFILALSALSGLKEDAFVRARAA